MSAPIAVKKVPLRSRMRFLPRLFGRRMMGVEGRIFTYASVVLPGYSGGLWDFYTTENGAGYMVPQSLDPVPQTLPGQTRWRPSEISGGEGQLSPDAAGLALTILAVNHEWNLHPSEDVLGQAWDRLMEVARRHVEAATLLRILD